MRAPTRFFIRLCPYLPLSICLPIDIDLVFYGAFDDRELIRSPTDTCIKLTSGVRLPTHQPNGECHAIAFQLHSPSSCPSSSRSKRYFRRRFGTRRNAKGDNKAIASNIKRPWIIIYVSREGKKGGLRIKKETPSSQEEKPSRSGESRRVAIIDRSFRLKFSRSQLLLVLSSRSYPFVRVADEQSER